MDQHNDKTCIQQNVPFSKSLVWDAQRDYYDSQGVEAWAEQVPSYVTSNPVIADHYAKMMVRFFQDYAAQHESPEKLTFYILELGAGTGQFSYYVVKRILYLLSLWGLEILSFCYVMTDFTRKNVEYWKEHSALQPLFAEGVMDCAVFDFEQDTYVRLENSNVTLSENSVSAPLTVIANYLFDTVKADVFQVKDQQVKESNVALYLSQKHVEANKINWPKVDFKYQNTEIAENYYQQPILDQILKEYGKTLEDTYIQFPVAALEGLDNLAALSNGKLFLLSSDKGHVSLSELDDQEQPTLAFHGSFSTMVNFHAIAEYFKLQDGDVCLQEEYDAFATGAFALGFKFTSMPALQAIIQQTIGGFAAGHFFHLYDHFEKTVNKASLESIASMLNFTFWDPAIFELATDRVSDLIDDADEDVLQYIARKLPLVAQQFYYMPGATDVLFLIAVFYQEIEEYEQAIEYFSRSEAFFPESYELCFNSGYCCLELGEYEQALSWFKRAVPYQPRISKELKQYMRMAEKQQPIPA